jgi:DNA-directed RNA polymerase beta' subunit
MNISDPVPSQVGSVGFERMTADFLLSVSVKHVQGVDTYDNLLTPCPGGLYDASLGAHSDLM